LRNLAPISISTYHRLEHLKQTIESLQKNNLAKDSILYIFSDAPKKGDEEIVAKVRKYICTIDGFKEVRIIEQKINDINKNMIDARTIPLNQFGKMIRMEDDNVVSSHFLQYMNDGLDFYENDKEVIAIGGHTPNLQVTRQQKKDIYFVRRFHPWGYGIWKDKAIVFNNLPAFPEIIEDKKFIKKVNEYGNDLLNMIELDSLGVLNAGDIKYCYFMNKHEKYMVLPTQTLVKNIGLDGSGVHCSDIDPYIDDLVSKKKKFEFEGLYYDKNIQKEYKSFYDKPSILIRVINKIKILIKKRLK